MNSSDLEHITSFLQQHHVLSLATSDGEVLSVCSLFYAYVESELSFIVASSDETVHITHLQKNSNIAGNIFLETKIVGKIQGVQFRGTMCILEDTALKKAYYKTFPYALALSPKLWQIRVNYFKMTDNTLGFGKKIIWKAL